jgi:hypothetical protein
MREGTWRIGLDLPMNVTYGCFIMTELKFDEDVFVRLVQLIKEPGELNTFFLQLEQCTESERMLTVAKLLQKMRKKNEDPQLIIAISLLATPQFFKILQSILGH